MILICEESHATTIHNALLQYKCACHREDDGTRIPLVDVLHPNEIESLEEYLCDAVVKAVALEYAAALLTCAAPLLAKIKAENKGQNADGDVECPVCGKNMRWAHAACNGHCIIACENPDCIQIRE